MTAPLRCTWLPRATQRVVPWRNGGGSTREVAIEPPDGSLAQGFTWRVSIAGVAADGPFSHLPGVDRTLWLLRGAGMALDVDGEPIRLERPLQRLDFAGERAVSARLLGGPTEDLNVMVTRALTSCRAEIVALQEGDTRHIELPDAQHLLLVLGGAAIVFGGVLGPGDAVRLDGAPRGDVLAADGRCTLLIASFTATARADAT